MNASALADGVRRRRLHAVAGACVSVFLLLACLLLLTRISASHGARTLDWTSYASFYLSIGLIYLLTQILWRAFAGRHRLTRSHADAFIDTGLLALGKYVPGKIWGLIARGAVGERGVAPGGRTVAVSVGEQLFSLLIGSLAVVTLASAGRGAMPGIGVLGVALTSLAAGTVVLRFARRRVAGGSSERTPGGHGIVRDLALTGGYGALWLASALPLVLLAANEIDLDVTAALQVATAFLAAMIVGWVAVFAPGGVGVREATFVWLAPEFLPWEQGLYLITLHRSLSLLFDLTFGTLCLALLVRRSRGHVAT